MQDCWLDTSVLAVVVVLAPLLLASLAVGEGLAVAAELSQAKAGLVVVQGHELEATLTLARLGVQRVAAVVGQALGQGALGWRECVLGRLGLAF